MEWCFEREVDDIVVPRDQGSLERMVSPDCWSQWGITALGAGSDHPRSNLFVGTNSACGQGLISFNGKNYTGASNMNNSGQGREREDHADKSRAVCQGLYNGSIMWPYDEDQARIDRMDDIFLYKLNFCNSLLEEDVTGADNPNESIRYSSESHYGMIASDSMLNDMISEPQYIPSTSHGVGNSMYLDKHAFSQSVDWENAEVSSTCPGKQDNLNCHSEKESSLEESVLQELERVTTQFTRKTRIHFRDALYRLAQNSKQPENLSQDVDIMMDQDDQPMLTSYDETLRIREVEITELQTNSIDRAIASLMFSKMNFVNEDDNETIEQPNCGVTQHRNSYCPQLARLAGDAEVPIVGRANC